MKRKKKHLTYKKERVLLSDVLPYDLPVTFTNRYLYRFLVDHKVEYRNGNVYWHKDDEALDEIIRLLVGTQKGYPVSTAEQSLYGNKVRVNSFTGSIEKLLVT